MIINQRNNQIIAKRVLYANTFLKRLLGLMGKKTMQEDCALVICPCQQVHTFFMRFSIDCVFIDNHFKVLTCYRAMKPWRICKRIKQAYAVIELPVGTINKTDIRVQDTLTVIRGSKDEI